MTESVRQALGGFRAAMLFVALIALGYVMGSRAGQEYAGLQCQLRGIAETAKGR